MNEAILTVVMFLYSVFDQRGDATNSGAFKWPNSGFQVIWFKNRIHIIRIDTVLTSDPERYVEYKTLKTVDRWHCWKWARFYLPPVYILSMCIWPSLLPAWWAFIPATALATIAWKVLPQPEHWKGR